MAKIINLDNYKIEKQREFFVNLYDFLNKNMDYSLDIIIDQLESDFTTLFNKYKIDPLCVNFFKIPNITFVTITFVNNSDIKDFFPETLSMNNHDNKSMFKNTLIKTIETFIEHYNNIKNIKSFELELDCIIDKGLKDILRMMPDNIVLV